MIYIGADHRGYELKVKVEKWMTGRDYDFEDMGAFEYDKSDDYVDYAIAVAQKVAISPEKHWGILMCGSGVGMSVAANKVKGIRAGLGFAPDQVHAGRKEDGINILVLPADSLEEVGALGLVEKFLETEFVKSDNYLRREEKISRYERESSQGKRS